MGKGKTRHFSGRRRGSVLIYSFLLMTIMFAMISLAVDFGHVQTIKTELQRCADATARGSLQEYLTYGSSVAQNYQATLAADNPVDANSGISPTVSVTWGWWNSSTKSFVAGAGTPIAVQAVVSRTTANRNSVPLTFPLITGQATVNTTCDVWASAVAAQSTQTLISFPSGFTSAAASLFLNGSTSIVGSHVRLTTTAGSLAGSAWYGSTIPVGEFSTTFSFQITSPNADGMAFVMQSTGKTALGSTGGGLGYAGINHSICVKFDLYNNSGEGANSTGVFSNGAAPYTPATDLTPTGLNLHSGDVFNVSMKYDGTTLTWTITDASTGSTGTYTSVINIPSVIGSSTAYAGFTAGTGGQTAQHDILSWSLTATGPVMMQ